MLKNNCLTFREIELTNVILEDLIVKKYHELLADEDNKILQDEYDSLKKMRNHLLDKNVRKDIFKLANLEWRS